MKKIAPLRKIEIKNFESLDHVILDFEDSPIISLVGNNGCGKTAVQKALRALLINENPNKQARRVKTGTAGFGVRVTDINGDYIEKIKYKKGTAGGSVYSGRVNGKEHEVNITTGIPDFVQEFTGIYPEKETKQVLQFKDHRSKLLFAETEASVNYQMYYNTLNLDDITKAASLGQEQLNGYKADVKYCESTLNNLLDKRRKHQSELKDIEPLLIIRNRLQEMMNVYQLLTKAATEKIQYQQLRLDNRILTVQEFYDNEIKQLELLSDALVDKQKYMDVREKNKQAVQVQQLNVFSDKVLQSTELLQLLYQDCMNYRQKQETNQEQVKVLALKEIDAFILDNLQSAVSLNNNKKQLDREKSENLAFYQLSLLEEEKLKMLEETTMAYRNLRQLQRKVPKELWTLQEISEETNSLWGKLLQEITQYQEKKGVYDLLNQQLEQLEQSMPVLSCPNCGYVIDLPL